MQEIGCIVNYLQGKPGVPADVHHIVQGGKRMGHSYTIPLSAWLHRGIKPWPTMSVDANTAQYGPSLAHNKRAFVERYGTELELLEKTNKLLSEIEGNIVGRVG